MRYSLTLLAPALVLWGYEDNATRFHSNGIKSEEFQFRIEPNLETGLPDTVRWGETLEWREDGSLSSRQNYEAGKLEGPGFSYYRTGEVAVRYYYRSGKLDSTVSSRRDGRIWERMVAGDERDTIITYDSLGNAEKRLGLGFMQCPMGDAPSQ